jgi:hypothetical protein
MTGPAQGHKQTAQTLLTSHSWGQGLSTASWSSLRCCCCCGPVAVTAMSVLKTASLQDFCCWSCNSTGCAVAAALALQLLCSPLLSDTASSSRSNSACPLKVSRTAGLSVQLQPTRQTATQTGRQAGIRVSTQPINSWHISCPATNSAVGRCSAVGASAAG